MPQLSQDTSAPRPPAGPVDGRLVPRFAGSATFARLPEIDRVSGYDVAILGVPFDNGTSYRPGARFGPMAVRQASRHLRPGHHVELDCSPFREIQVADAGDVPVTPYSIDMAVEQIGAHAAELVSQDVGCSAGRWRRDWITRNRPATKSPSV
jgi:agmatinase